MRLSVVLGQWLDRPIAGDLDLAVAADRLGYGQLWVPEMAKADSPTMAAIIAARTQRIELVLGPLAVTVRSPVQIAIALQTLASLGRPVHVALGTSSSVVARWHGRSRAGAADRLDAALDELATLLDGGRVNGYRLPHPPTPRPTITVAAFGQRARKTARRADRMVLNMVTAGTARDLAETHPDTAVWLCAALDPSPAERDWLRRGFVGYLAAPGYAEMFEQAGFDDLVAFARTGAAPKQLFERIPDELLDHVALVGNARTIGDRIDEYARAGVSEIGVVVPPLDLPCGRPTLELLAG